MCMPAYACMHVHRLRTRIGAVKLTKAIKSSRDALTSDSVDSDEWGQRYARTMNGRGQCRKHWLSVGWNGLSRNWEGEDSTVNMENWANQRYGLANMTRRRFRTWAEAINFACQGCCQLRFVSKTQQPVVWRCRLRTCYCALRDLAWTKIHWKDCAPVKAAARHSYNERTWKNWTRDLNFWRSIAPVTSL